MFLRVGGADSSVFVVLGGDYSLIRIQATRLQLHVKVA